MNPPASYSVDQKDYDPAVGQRLVIRLNGEVVDKVIEYDVEAGEVRRCKTDVGGKLIIDRDHDEVVQETLTGIVTVAFKDA